MGAIGRHLARSYLRKAGAEHRRKYPQLACFAFDLITDYIHLDGRYEVEELDFLRDRIFPQLKSRGIALDIGANIGNHSLFFAEHFDQVYSFEPHPRTFRLLSINADLARNVTPLNFGLSDANGVQTAYFPRQNYAAASLKAEGTSDEELHPVDFALKRLDDVEEVQGLDGIGFVKVDVERHELECFAGAENTLKTHHPLIAIEILGADVADGDTPALKALRDYGYTHFYALRVNRPLAWAPKPIAKLMTTLLGVLFNYRPPKDFSLEPLQLDPERNYSMVLCHTETLN